MKYFFLIILLLTANFVCYSQSFTQVTDASLVINQIGGTKEGGAVWADFDNDGDLDVAINTGTPSSSNTKLYQNNGNGTFSDVTATHIKDIGTGNQCCERSLIWGDLNNDGFIDLIGNTHDRIEIYLNRGTDTTTQYMFGVSANMTANQTITSATDGLNAEGLGLLDYDSDGYLDLVFENDQHGIDIFRNEKTGTRGVASTFMTQVTFDSSGNLGLPEGSHGSANTGDYLATGDYNGDGFTDILARKNGGVSDLWTNNQDGTFSVNSTFSEGSSGSETNKGGVIFCDFDSDGDFDIYWTDYGTNQIWLQHPIGTFTATGQPTIPGTPDIDGCACADVDNDGDTDLFLGNNSGDSYLFVNSTTVPNSTSDLSFTRTDIAVNADAEGVNLVDYDGDGDSDIYINVNGGNNQLWENDLCDGGGCEFVKVVMEECVDGTSVTRPVVGATLVIKDEFGNIVSAAQDMNSAMGHGAQNPAVVNFGIPDAAETYTIEITFPAKVVAPSSTPTVETYSYSFIPNELVDNTLVLTSVNAADGSICDFSLLPIELLYFKGGISGEKILLEWATTTEINNDYFTIEKSTDGRMFYTIAQIQGAGNSKQQINYSYEDISPAPGINYYRLKQTDYDGTSKYYEAIGIYYDNKDMRISVFPNPFADEVNLKLYSSANSSGRYLVYDINGNEIRNKSVKIKKGLFNYNIDDLNTLSPGFYFMKVKIENRLVGSFKVIKSE